MKSKTPGGNLFAGIPDSLPAEIEEELLARRHVSIRRILSRGQASPGRGWFDQEDDEWVVVLQGEGVLAFSEGGDIHLKVGDYCHIPAHVKHRVKWTPEDEVTVWLAIHFPAGEGNE